MRYSEIVPNPPKIEIQKFEYPKEAVEHIIDSIVLLNKSNDGIYNHHIDETIRILNNHLEVLLKPYLVLKEKFE